MKGKEVYFYRQGKQTHYVFVNEKELKGSKRTNYKRRVARGELELLDSYQRFKLYKVHPHKRNAPVPPGAVKDKPSKKSKTPKSKRPRKPSKRRTRDAGVPRLDGLPSKGGSEPRGDEVDIDRELREELPQLRDRR